MSATPNRTARNSVVVRLIAVVALVPLAAEDLRADESSELLARVIAAHKAARESIRTLEARFSIGYVTPGPLRVLTGTYLRSPDGVLIRTGTEGQGTTA